tara:strand:+ start:259 stop:636 length:378 start_codon:yes stop_codon:yes gene_type:complete
MLFITNYLPPFALNLLATSMIYVGILFISSQFLPSLFENIYSNTNAIVRTIIATITLIAPSNMIIGFVYKNFPASVAGITNIISVVLILTIIAILIDNIKISTTIIVSLILAIAACSFLLYNLSK